MNLIITLSKKRIFYCLNAQEDSLDRFKKIQYDKFQIFQETKINRDNETKIYYFFYLNSLLSFKRKYEKLWIMYILNKKNEQIECGSFILLTNGALIYKISIFRTNQFNINNQIGKNKISQIVDIIKNIMIRFEVYSPKTIQKKQISDLCLYMLNIDQQIIDEQKLPCELQRCIKNYKNVIKKNRIKNEKYINTAFIREINDFEFRVVEVDIYEIKKDEIKKLVIQIEKINLQNVKRIEEYRKYKNIYLGKIYMRKNVEQNMMEIYSDYYKCNLKKYLQLRMSGVNIKQKINLCLDILKIYLYFKQQNLYYYGLKLQNIFVHKQTIRVILDFSKILKLTQSIHINQQSIQKYMQEFKLISFYIFFEPDQKTLQKLQILMQQQRYFQFNTIISSYINKQFAPPQVIQILFWLITNPLVVSLDWFIAYLSTLKKYIKKTYTQ